MFIKLEPLNETEKAYQLTENCWVPKSVLDGQGLEKPYYKIPNWWIKTIIKKMDGDDENARKQFVELVNLTIEISELPEDVQQIWQKYWGSYSEPDDIDPHDRRQEIGEWELGIYN